MTMQQWDHEQRTRDEAHERHEQDQRAIKNKTDPSRGRTRNAQRNAAIRRLYNEVVHLRGVAKDALFEGYKSGHIAGSLSLTPMPTTAYVHSETRKLIESSIQSTNGLKQEKA